MYISVNIVTGIRKSAFDSIATSDNSFKWVKTVLM